MTALEASFYARPVLVVARELIGCTVQHGDAAGLIVETEAYHESEPACHAFIGLTPRTRTLFGEPGHAYVYRSYGIHAMLNAVCEPAGVGAAVLIRAVEPRAGIETMRARRTRPGGSALRERDLCSGPGKLAQALGIALAQDASSLVTGPVRIHAREWAPGRAEVLESTRVGITKAPELRWRFCLAGSPYVSRPHPRPHTPVAVTGAAARARLA